MLWDVITPLRATVLGLTFVGDISIKFLMRFLDDIVTPLQVTVLGLPFEDEINTETSVRLLCDTDKSYPSAGNSNLVVFLKTKSIQSPHCGFFVILIKVTPLQATVLGLSFRRNPYKDLIAVSLWY